MLVILVLVLSGEDGQVPLRYTVRDSSFGPENRFRFSKDSEKHRNGGRRRIGRGRHDQSTQASIPGQAHARQTDGRRNEPNRSESDTLTRSRSGLTHKILAFETTHTIPTKRRPSATRIQCRKFI